MRLEFLLQFIVPLTFLAIWALTSLLNRDAQPLPPRPGAGRMPGPGPGPNRGGAGGGFSPSSRGELMRPGSPAAPGRPSPAGVDRTPPARWSSATVQAGRPGSMPPRAADDGIVIIESETRGTQGSSTFSPSAAASGSRASRGTTAAARRAASARARSTPLAPPRAIESERPKALTGLTGQSLGQRRGKTLEITPLSMPMSPISSSPLTSNSPTPAPEVARTAARQDDPSLSIDDLRAMLASPKRLREVALLGELLQPPVTLRGSRRPR